MAPDSQPLADVADARAYLPRVASEEVLTALARWLDGDGDTAVVAGVPGVGTTLVLRVFEARERVRRRVLFSPFLHMEPEALECWLAWLALGSSPAPPGGWLASLRSETGGSPLLLVDDAHAAAPPTLIALGRLRQRSAPDLRICLGGCRGPALDRASEAVRSRELLTLSLPAWSEEDLRGLAEAECAHPALDADQRQRLARVDLDALAAAAEGSPRLLRNALSERCACVAPIVAAPLARRALPEPASLLEAAPAPRLEPAEVAPVTPAVPPAVAPVVEVAPLLPIPEAAPEAVLAPVDGTPAVCVTASDPAPILKAPPPPPQVLEPAEVAPAVVRAREPLVDVGPPPRPPARVAAATTPDAPQPAVRTEPTARSARRGALRLLAYGGALALGFGIGLLIGWERGEPERPTREAPATAAGAPMVSAPPPVAALPREPAPARVDVQVNAHPWASIRLDGRPLGVTPLLERGVPSGDHEFEATFRDGRRLRQVIRIGPDSRFVSFR